MSDKSQEKDSVQQDSSIEASLDDGSAPPTDNMIRYYYDNVSAESLAKNMYNLSLDSNLDYNDGDSHTYASSREPPLPFVFNNYINDEDDYEECGIDYKISKIGVLDHMAVNSPRWYANVRSHSTIIGREEVSDKAPWAVKLHWDNTNNAGDNDFGPAIPPLI